MFELSRWPSGDGDVRQTAAVGAHAARRAGGRVDAAGGAGGGPGRALRRAAGPARPGRAALGTHAAAGPRTEEHAGLARVSSTLVLIAVVHENLQAVRVARDERHVPSRLGPEPLGRQTGWRGITAREHPVVLRGV